MIIDYLLQFTPNGGQTLSAAKESDYTIDFEQKSPTTGMAVPTLYAIVTVKEAVTGKLTVALQDSDTESSGFADCASASSVTAPAAGTKIVIPVPLRHKRYLRINFGGAPTAGKVEAFITQGVQDNPGFEQAPSIK